MKRTLLSLSLLLTGAFIQAQTVLLDEGFENYTDFSISGFGSWLTLDLDELDTYTGGGPVVNGTTTVLPNWDNAGDPMAFQIFNLTNSNATNNATSTPSDQEVRNFSPHGGQKCAVSWAGVPEAPDDANNDWLITPSLTLGASSNILTFWVKALSPDFTEDYKVGIYTGTGTPTSSANFTTISTPATLTAPYANWTEVTINLDAYAGQTVRIGFNYMSSDQYMFMLDDVKVTTSGVLATSEISKSKSEVSVYPNPTKGEVTVKTDKKVKSSTVIDMTGRSLLNTNTANADLSALPKGTYLLQVEFADGTKTSEKIIKQ
ncbi:choice-of-anchor J domain-containing protein [Chryseobacterium sp. MYb264]|uniref:T9SS-dependent choice-of-anchor J family protein n=1 Tax=Chryseobacterium sp. MYb264 TaxID=2745153 RepID=UPI002E0DD43A|nr:choice-of-anchor J domain-containing protein [Chryseobacterium sp. MYb264]